MKAMLLVLACVVTLASAAPSPGSWGHNNKHVVIHVPYHVHTVHHHHVKKVHVPVIQKEYIHVHDDHHHNYHYDHADVKGWW